MRGGSSPPRVYRAPELYQLLLTFALVLVVADAVRYFWGADNKTVPAAPGLAGSAAHRGQLFPSYDLAVIVFARWSPSVSGSSSTATRWGVLIRAATQDREMVAALGVDQRHLFTGVFVSRLLPRGTGRGAPGAASRLSLPSWTPRSSWRPSWWW
jgi:branched-chain amino acid transport system permease protein